MASILYVTPWLRDGGIERALQTEAPWLARRGHRVEVASWSISELLAGHRNPVLATLETAGIRVRRLPARGRLQLCQRALTVAALALRSRVDVVIGQELLGGVVALLAKALTANWLTVAVEVHSASSTYIETVKSQATLQLARRLYRRADGIRAVSESVAGDAARFFGLPPRTISTIYNCFDLDEIRRLAAEDTPALIGLGPYVVACGRLVKLKGFADLIDAFRLARARHVFKLIILGDGPDRAQLVAHAHASGVAADVLFPGFVPNPFPYFARASAFIMSSRYGESFCRVLAEALACGTPVISSRCRWGPEEVLESGRYGRLYDVGDVGGLAEHMLDLLGQEKTIDLVDAGRRRAADFAVDRVLPTLEQFHLDIVAAGARGRRRAVAHREQPRLPLVG